MQDLTSSYEGILELDYNDALAFEGGRSVRTWATEAVVGVAFGLVGIAVFEYFYNG